MERIAKSVSNGRKVERLSRRRKNKKGIQERKAQNKIKRGLQNTIKKGRKETILKELELELEEPKRLTFKQRKELHQLPRNNHTNKLQQLEINMTHHPIEAPLTGIKGIYDPVKVDLTQPYSPIYDPVKVARDRTQKELSGLGDLAMMHQTVFSDEVNEEPLYNPQSPNESPPYRPSESDFYQSDSPLFTSDMLNSFKENMPLKPQKPQGPKPRTRRVTTGPVSSPAPKPAPKPRTRKATPIVPGQAKPTPARPKASRRKNA